MTEQANTPTPQDEDLRQKIHEITQTMLVALSEWQAGVTIDYTSIKNQGREDLFKFIKARQEEAIRHTEKAYGGCHACYGKGYATHRSAITGVDTDQAIGSPGGRIYHPFEEMRFCTCDRGQQLEKLLTPNTER
ncbi:hypothetical protein [Williamsia sterculiae]|uniref:hypothetical protein n=1 Tax=Williamsia sterculiae TaxID=1344003 RepID=UPI00117C9A37|nr:hypothetical protein [Williamsia sterculiae]